MTSLVNEEDLGMKSATTNALHVPGLNVPVHLAEDAEAARTGCTGLRLWSCALELSAMLVAEEATLLEEHARLVELG